MKKGRQDRIAETLTDAYSGIKFQTGEGFTRKRLGSNDLQQK